MENETNTKVNRTTSDLAFGSYSNRKIFTGIFMLGQRRINSQNYYSNPVSHLPFPHTLIQFKYRIAKTLSTLNTLNTRFLFLSKDLQYTHIALLKIQTTHFTSIFFSPKVIKNCLLQDQQFTVRALPIAMPSDAWGRPISVPWEAGTSSYLFSCSIPSVIQRSMNRQQPPPRNSFL